MQDAEQRYAPVEGEALAVAWSLEHTRYFTLGCDDLVVVTDHKPLIKLLGDRTLDEIRNTRLFRLKQRTLPWYFQISHLPGVSNDAADAISRYPSPSGSINLLEANDLVESAIMATIQSGASSDFSISWKTIAHETMTDPVMKPLLNCVRTGFLEFHNEDPSIKPFWKYRDALYELDGVILYDDRAVIPPSLRGSILSTLHAAHQGVSAMKSRASSIVFWPGITADIDNVRNSCKRLYKKCTLTSQAAPCTFDNSINSI